MPLSRQQKQAVIEEASGLFSSSRLTVLVYYRGLTVGNLQALRRLAAADGTKLKVIKNRLAKRVLASRGTPGEVLEQLAGQLLFAFNDSDEAAAARCLDNFAKQHPVLSFCGAISSGGEWLSADDVSQLAALPDKQVLRGQLAALVASPLGALEKMMTAGPQSLLRAMHQRADLIRGQGAAV